MKIYDKEGNVVEREPVDARECIASGAYFADNPVEPKADEKKPAGKK